MNLSPEQQAIALAEIEKYKYVWENCETYNDKHHDVDLWERLKVKCAPRFIRNVIVLGCGDGSLVRLLGNDGILSAGVDIYKHPHWDSMSRCFVERYSQQPLWEELPLRGSGDKWDLAICADVMEHIPEILLPIVFKNISKSCRRVLFQIADMKSNFAGYDLHPSRHEVDWWMEAMWLMGGMVTTEKLVNETCPPGRFVIDWKRD